MTVQSVSARRHTASATEDLNRGDQGPRVSALQEKLNALGFGCGRPDGDFGPRTEAAVRSFQRAHGLTVDGVVGPRTEAALRSAHPSTGGSAGGATGGTTGGTTGGSHGAQAPQVNLRRGSTGTAVKDLQSDLNRLGLNAGPVDGQYGPRTQGAVKHFQAQWGLPTTGNYGPETRGALNRALAGERAPHPNATAPGSTGGAGSTGSAGGAGSIQPGGSAAGRAALESARAQVGIHEATGNNDGVPAQRYSGGRQEPWCANFVSWNFRQAGHPLPGNQRMLASVQYMEDTMKNHGKWFARGTHTPQPGDIIFFRWADGGRHVGMVESVSGGRVNTIEGNTSNGVARRSYSLDSGSITGYARD